jgi:hypothetical protein
MEATHRIACPGAAAKQFETRAGLLFGSLHQAMEMELSIISPWSGGTAALFFRLKAASPRSSPCVPRTGCRLWKKKPPVNPGLSTTRTS